MKKIVCGLLGAILMGMPLMQAGKLVILNWKQNTGSWDGNIKISEKNHVKNKYASPYMLNARDYNRRVDEENKNKELLVIFDLIARRKDRSKIKKELKKLSKEQLLSIRDIVSGANPLHYAVKKDRKEVMDDLIDKAPELLITPDQYGRIPLHWAAEEEGRKVFNELLVQYRQEQLNYKDNLGRTPLHWTVARGKNKYVEHLIKKGADVSIQDNLGLTPLHYAVSIRYYLDDEWDKINKGRLEFGGVLIGTGVTTIVVGGLMPPALVVGGLAAAVGASLMAVETISTAIKDEKDKDKKDHIHSRRDRIVETLLAASGSTKNWINMRSKQGETALYVAVIVSNDKQVKQLLNAGADQSIANEKGLLPLHVAAMRGDKGVCEVLMKTGKEFATKQDNEGVAPVMYALLADNKEILKEFFGDEQVANQIKQSKEVSDGIILYAAAGSGELLVFVEDWYKKHGIAFDWTVTNAQKMNVLHMMATFGHKGTMERVVRLVKDISEPVLTTLINAQDVAENTPLHYAVLTGNKELVDYLLEKGADQAKQNAKKLTPYALAQKMYEQASREGNKKAAEMYKKILEINNLKPKK